MKKYEYTPEIIKEIILGSGLTITKFCKNAGINRGDLNRVFRGVRKLSANNEQKIHEYAKVLGLDFIAKKSLLKRIVEFIKG